MKIAIIDEGIDQTHPFFSPAGYTMPAGYPKGQTAYTTAKVIVARAFPPARPVWKHAAKPFDPEFSSHGTHVAGIAAGNANTVAEGSRISGVAPRAYLGNYKALTIPTDADVGLDGNSPELVAAIEAAVADGMDVINMSLGEPEIEPSRDIVVKALAAAARAGVVSVVAAGNDYADFGRGSVGSPGSAPDAITVAAVSTTRGGADDVVASFSSSGPTPLSLRLKPEVSAPGISILSAAPGAAYAIAVRHQHGRTARRRSGRAPAPAPPDLDTGSGQGGARAHRRPGVRGRRQVGGALDRARRRRCRQPAARRQPTRLRGARRALVRVRRTGCERHAVGRAHRRRRRRRALERDRRAADGGDRSDAVGARDGERPRSAARVRHDDDRARRRALRLRRPHARGRAAPDPLLVPHGNARARERRQDAAAPRRRLLVDDEGRHHPRHPLPLSGAPDRVRLRRRAARARARLPRHARTAGDQLRRRRHEPRAERPRRAENRPRRRRAPADRVCRAAVQPQSVPAHVRRSRPRGRDDPARGRGLRRRLRQPVGRERRRLLVPLLGQRHDAADRDAPDEVRQARRAARRRRLRPRRRRRSGLARREGRRRRSGAAASRPDRCAARPRGCARAGTCSGSRSPTTRRRGTWRTSARSCRTRAS